MKYLKMANFLLEILNKKSTNNNTHHFYYNTGKFVSPSVCLSVLSSQLQDDLSNIPLPPHPLRVFPLSAIAS